MYYLHLKFDNCGLISCINKPILHLNRDYGEFGKNFNNKELGHDLTNPIPYTLLSNVLHVLCGEIPAPTKRRTIIKRIKALDEIAQNSYIKYDYNIKLNDNGYPIQSEKFQTNKWNWSSTKKGVFTTFKLYDGKRKNLDGFYNWAYFKRSFSKENCDKLTDFVSKFIGYNALSSTLKEAVFHISKFWNDENFQKIVHEFIDENKKISYGSWLNVFFNIPCTTQNTNVKSRTPLFETRGVTNITYINGEIICPIDNEEIIQKIYHGEGFATLLEGGLVYVIGIENIEPYPNFQEIFEKIR